jgi:hypothetical protein
MGGASETFGGANKCRQRFGGETLKRNTIGKVQA